MGTKAEQVKLIELAIQQHAKFLLVICALVCVVVITWAVISWKLNDDRRQPIYDDLGVAAANLKTISQNVVKGTAEIAPTLKGLQDTQARVGAVADALAGATDTIKTSVDKRLQTVDRLAESLVAVSDEARAQIKQNGDAARDVLVSADHAVISLDTQISELGHDGSRLLRTADSRVAKVLDDFDVILVGPDGVQGLVKKGNYIAEEAGKTSRNIDLLTADIQAKTHTILYPPAEHGFTGFMKKFILRPIQTYGGGAYLVERLLYNLP